MSEFQKFKKFRNIGASTKNLFKFKGKNNWNNTIDITEMIQLVSGATLAFKIIRFNSSVICYVNITDRKLVSMKTINWYYII